MRRRTGAILAALVVAVAILAAPAATAGNKWQTIAAPTVRWGAMQVSGDFIYGHNPGGGDYATKGAWADGTVLEARGYFVERSDGKVYSVTKWRTRKGTTAVLSDWNTGGSNSATYSEYLSYTTGFTYGHRDDYPDYLATSAIQLNSNADCSQVAGTDRYQGVTAAVTANPAGPNAVSGSKTQGTDFEDNNIMDCGEQA